MNILAIVVLLLLLGNAISGVRVGFIKGIRYFLRTIGGIASLIVIVKGYFYYKDGNMVNLVFAIIILIVIAIITKLIRWIFVSCDLISKLPVIHFFDKLIGFFFGILEGLVIVWAAFIAFGYFDVPVISEWILAQVNESSFLSVVYHTNFLVYLIAKFLK